MSDDPSLEDLLASAVESKANDRLELIDKIRGHVDLDSLQEEAALVAAQLLAGSGEPGDLSAVARLSLAAHRSGISGAGRVHAEASDKIALYSGQPQLYGTVMLEQHGEVVQPPVNPRITEAERAELGVPSLAELHERARRVTRELAIERGGQPGLLPDGQRWCRVSTEPTEAELRERMAIDGSAWAEGDVLTLVRDSPAPFVVQPTFAVGSWPVGDLQVLQVRVERLDEAVITYSFVDADEMAAMSFSRGSHDGRFRGANAPPELPSRDRDEPLAGTSFEHTLESDALGEPRRVTVYSPPADRAPVAVVYSTDGHMIRPYLRRLDRAIDHGTAPPVVVVAAHAAGFDPLLGNLRAAEYLPGFDHQRFENHQRFFVDELAAWAEAELAVPTEAEQRAVFGCSDGAGHALMVARRHPERFGHAFAFSTGMPPDLAEGWTAEHPFVHLCAGTLEGGFHQATEAWAGYLMMHGAAYHFTERVAGHDLIQWAEELPRSLTRAWGGDALDHGFVKTR